jgi:hypothetical protein
VTTPSEDEIRAALATIKREEMKSIVRDAIREWLTEQLSTFGWWTLRGILAMALAMVVWFSLVKAGWAPPHPTTSAGA